MDPSKKRSFEDHWKEAFDEASVPPPASAWEGIEARLDQDIAKHGFEDQWKKAFDEASVIPPASAWEGIEARLDQNDDKVIPLWWRSPKLWLAAASVAAVLVTGGIWLGSGFNGQHRGKSDMAAGTSPGAKNESVIASAESDSSSGIHKNQGNNTPAPALAHRGTAIAAADPLSKSDNVAKSHARIKSKAVLPDNSADEKTALLADKKESPSGQTPEATDITNTGQVLPAADKNQVALARAANAIPENQSEKLQISAEMLAVRPYKELDVYFQKRYVFYKQEVQQEAPLIKKHTEYWAGVGLMPASFNPDVNLKASPTSFATQSYSSQKSLTGKNEPGFSYALQTQGGMRVSKHWSVETGLSYLQGNSNYEGGGYLLDAATSGSSNVLETALADVYYTQKGAQPSNLVNNSVYIDITKQVRNDYRYLQLPVQAGFTLNPDGKLSYSVLGGMMANFFLNNELESANGNVIKTTAADEVYKGINWSATTGLRFNYRVSSKWRATLTGSYQKAVTSGFRTNQNLESHPYLYGISWGMRYSF